MRSSLFASLVCIAAWSSACGGAGSDPAEGPPPSDANVDSADTAANVDAKGTDSGSSSDSGPIGPAPLPACTFICSAGGLCEDLGGYLPREKTENPGVCVPGCTGSPPSCPAGQRCAEAPHGGGMCTAVCTSDADCPAQLSCFKREGFCLLDCERDPKFCTGAQVCAGKRACVTPTGLPSGKNCHPTYASPEFSPPLDTSKTASSLTAAERVQFCDSVAILFGDYGCERKCSSGATVRFEGTRADCVARLEAKPCPAKLSDLLGCYNQIARNMCDAAAAASSSYCKAVTACTLK